MYKIGRNQTSIEAQVSLNTFRGVESMQSTQYKVDTVIKRQPESSAESDPESPRHSCNKYMPRLMKNRETDFSPIYLNTRNQPHKPQLTTFKQIHGIIIGKVPISPRKIIATEPNQDLIVSQDLADSFT